MNNFLKDTSFYMLVRLPGGTTGRYELTDWFSTSNRSKYRWIVDQEINIKAPAIDKLIEDYPGVKFLMLASNPYRRAWNAYKSVLEAMEDPKFKALLTTIPHDTFESFILGLSRNELPLNWPFWWNLKTPQCHWAERNGKKVDYVIREECINDDMAEIREYFLREDLIDLTLDDAYLDQYTNEMKSQVEELFDEDFRYFDYKKLTR